MLLLMDQVSIEMKVMSKARATSRVDAATRKRKLRRGEGSRSSLQAEPAAAEAAAAAAATENAAPLAGAGAWLQPTPLAAKEDLARWSSPAGMAEVLLRSALQLPKRPVVLFADGVCVGLPLDAQNTTLFAFVTTATFFPHCFFLSFFRKSALFSLSLSLLPLGEEGEQPQVSAGAAVASSRGCSLQVRRAAAGEAGGPRAAAAARLAPPGRHRGLQPREPNARPGGL